MPGLNFSDQYNTLQQNLENSPTAYTSDTPTSSDVNTQKQMMAMAAAQKKIQAKADSAAYYGPPGATEDNPGNPPDYMGRFLKVLGAGVSLPVGAIESLTGKGTKQGLFENMANAFENNESYGDLLRKFGVNNTVSKVAGFGMDVALDPVNWLMAGTESFVPRIFTGALKGGVEGAELGAKSVGADILKTVARPAKWFGAEDTYKNIASKAANLKTAYDEKMGVDFAKKIAEGGALQNKINAAWSEVADTPVAQKMKELFAYSPQDYYEKQKAAEDLVRSRDVIAVSNPSDLKNMITSEMAGMMDHNEVTDFLKKIDANHLNVQQVALARARQAIGNGTEMATERPKLGSVFNTDDAVKAFSDEYINDLALRKSAADLEAVGISQEEAKNILEGRKAVGSGDKYFTGVKFYDDLNKAVSQYKIGDVDVGKKMLDVYRSAIDLFKIQKIGNAATMAYAVVGNIFMGGMAGKDIMRPSFYKTLGEAWKLTKGTPTIETLASLVDNPQVMDFVGKYPGLFKNQLGFSPSLLFGNDSINKALDEYAKLGSTILSDEQKLAIQSSVKDLINEGLVGKYGAKGVQEEFSPLMQARKAAAGADKTATFSADTTFISNELGKTGVSKIIERLKTIADNPGELVETVDETGKKVMQLKKFSDAQRFGAKALNWYLTKPMSYFDKIDQSFKIGNFIGLVRDGVTKDELTKLSRWSGGFKIGQDVFAGADGMWRFSPDAAMKIGGDIYMNYAAMPGAVKVLRSLPFMGSPFFSFSYAMMAKTGKAAINNPEFLNKVNFALHELNGGKSPLERKALTTSQYQWYNKNGMVSLPWFNENPMYINLASFIPYYTMNIFQPLERNYTKNIPGTIAKAIDTMPFFKTPEGQVFTDYFLMPHLMQQTNPSGSFGQPLYPSNATTFQKNVLYPLRTLAEAETSPMVGALGSFVPESMMQYLPSYRARQIGFASRGETSVGIPSTSESATARTARAILATYGGINLYPMQLLQKSNFKK